MNPFNRYDPIPSGEVIKQVFPNGGKVQAWIPQRDFYMAQQPHERGTFFTRHTLVGTQPGVKK